MTKTHLGWICYSLKDRRILAFIAAPRDAMSYGMQVSGAWACLRASADLVAVGIGAAWRVVDGVAFPA